MASAPKCKLCGETHWANAPHVWKTAPERPAKPRAEAPVSAAPAPPAADPDELARLKAIEAREVSRKAKAAAYMRSYRAKQAAK